MCICIACTWPHFLFLDLLLGGCTCGYYILTLSGSGYLRMIILLDFCACILESTLSEFS
jgi:hypothetical protein